MSKITRVFFATDVHGSTLCFKKFVNAGRFYRADVVIMGGDITGKVLVPIVGRNASEAKAYAQGAEYRLSSEQEIYTFESRMADAGCYTYRCDSDELEALSVNPDYREDVFKRLILHRVEEWATLADERLKGTGIRGFWNAGNDDITEVDPILESSEVLERPEGRVVEIDETHTMISTGFANLTPFGCPRDVPEEELGRKIGEMSSRVPDSCRCIFNVHCPPYNSQLDRAPTLDAGLQPRTSAFGTEYGPAGSFAVREAIELEKPLLGLHGHIHESRAAVRIGRTLCINPGSEYHEGILRGTLVELRSGVVRSYSLTCG